MNQSTSDIQPALADQSTPMASKRPLQSDINAVKRELAQALHGEAKIHTIPQKGDQNRRYIITMKDGCNAYNHIPEVEKVCLRNGLLINETSIDHIELATEFHTR